MHQDITEPSKKERAPGARSFLLEQWSWAALFHGGGAGAGAAHFLVEWAEFSAPIPAPFLLHYK